MTKHKHNIITWEHRKNDHIHRNDTHITTDNMHSLMNQKGSSAIGNHDNTIAEHGEIIAIGVTEVIVPSYGEITLDKEGRAYFPYDFLPALVDKLPEEWYYATYPWFKYFDNTQRDATGTCVRAPSELATVGPDNVNKWKQFVKRMFVKRFKEEGRFHYGMEMGKW